MLYGITASAGGLLLHRQISFGCARTERVMTALLLVAALAWSNTRGAVSMMQVESPRLLAAQQAVQTAQTKVDRDWKVIRGLKQHRLNSLVSTPDEWLKYGPVAKVKGFPEATDSEKATLEDPDSAYTKTPRVKRNNRFGPNQRYCPGGNCENMDAAGIVSDRWPSDVYSSVPWFGFDPDASPERMRHLNQREDEYASISHPENYHPPVQWGVGAAPEENPDGFEGQGTIAAADRGVAALEANGVNHDSWPVDLYSAFPWVSWDKTEFDQTKHKDILPGADPLAAIDNTRKSDAPLEAAGVTVNHLPFEDSDREFNHADGMMDKLVVTGDAPAWRKGGAAPQELPASFLLREHPDMSGPQPTADSELGVEVEPEMAKPRNVWDSLGCGPQGCLGARQGEEGEKFDGQE